MNGGITEVSSDGIPSVLRVNALEVLRHFVKSFVPPEPLPTVRSPAHGIFQPVFIIVKILQGHGLRADVPAAERVVFVTADVQTLVILNSDFDATYRFAEIAVAIMKGAIVGGSHGTVAGKFPAASRSHLGKELDSLASRFGLRHYEFPYREKSGSGLRRLTLKGVRQYEIRSERYAPNQQGSTRRRSGISIGVQRRAHASPLQRRGRRHHWAGSQLTWEDPTCGCGAFAPLMRSQKMIGNSP